MCKTLGAAMIIISTVFLSYSPLNFRKQRMRLLYDLIQDLQYVHKELQTNLSSIPELIEFLCHKSGLYTRNIYRALQTDFDEYGISIFDECWLHALEQYKMYLTAEEFYALSNLSSILGKYILEEQLSAIDVVIQILQTGYNSSKSDYMDKNKLYLGFGTSLGVMIAVLLV